MAKQAMHNDMQIVAYHLVETGVEATDHRIRLEVDSHAVGCKRVAPLHDGRAQLHLPQRHVEEAELHHELHTRLIDYFERYPFGAREAVFNLLGCVRHASSPHR